MSLAQIKEFLIEMGKNKELFKKISEAPTANEIASIAYEFGYEFSGEELKNISSNDLDGVKIKKQDTTPSYNFGEAGN